MKKYFSIATLLLVCTQAYAENFYVNFGVGGFFSNTSSSYTESSNSHLYSPTVVGTSLFILPNVTWKNNFNNGVNVSLASGYHFTPNYRAEVEFLYQNLKRDISGSYKWQEINSVTQAVYAQSIGNPITKTSSNVNLYSFMTNGFYDFKNNTKWTPFIGGGLGIAWISSGSTNTGNTLIVDDPATPLIESAPVSQHSASLYGTAFAWQFKAGLSYQWDECKSISLNYRLFGTSQFQAGNSNITSNPGTTVATQFSVSKHNISGILTNALELNMRFDI